MKKAFEQNVSRAKPRLRLGTALAELSEQTEKGGLVDAEEPQALVEEAPGAEASTDLAAQVRARIEQNRQARVPATEALTRALTTPEVAPAAPTPEPEAPQARAAAPEPAPAAQAVTHAAVPAPVAAPAVAAPVARAEPVAFAEPPPEVTEIQQPPLPSSDAEADATARRERLKERLKAVRENPRPEPLPASVAQAGVLAVERIAHLQAELTKVKALNLSVTQELEGARRQSERATEEARSRMDEAQRLSSELEARAKLLSELERELSALEGERDEALFALQESRLTLEAAGQERLTLQEEIAKRDKALAESLSEEERIAGELEAARDEAASLRRSVDALTSERDTLARQVADLTAERAELLEARKALEAVHRALSQAVVR